MSIDTMISYTTRYNKYYVI